MDKKTVVRLLPVCLGLFSGLALADTDAGASGPYSLGLSETIQHQTNINREAAGSEQADWLSSTVVRGGLDQRLGRNELVGSLAVNFDRYKEHSNPNTTGYTGSLGLNWSTIGDLSGTLVADSQRHQYLYGADTSLGQSVGRNIETDNHVGGTVQLGGSGRWVIFAGADGSQRHYSAASFASNEEHQWSANGGTRYLTSADLSFGIQGAYTHGEYPNLTVNGEADTFSLRSLDLTSHLQASGNSILDARIGYSNEQTVGQTDQNFINGALSWNWTPPSHFSVSVNLSRDANANTGSSSQIADNSTASLTGRSINSTARASVTYALSAKVNLVATGQYVQRKYSNTAIGTDATTGDTTYVSGSNRTGVYGFYAHYSPTRITDLSCGYSREIRHADAKIVSLTPSYTDNTVLCSAAIKFD